MFKTGLFLSLFAVIGHIPPAASEPVISDSRPSEIRPLLTTSSSEILEGLTGDTVSSTQLLQANARHHRAHVLGQRSLPVRVLPKKSKVDPATESLSEQATTSSVAMVTGTQIYQEGSSIRLFWNPSATPNVKYRIFINGLDFGETPHTSLSNGSVTPGELYTYKIIAVDANGNESPAASVSITARAGAAPAHNFDYGFDPYKVSVFESFDNDYWLTAGEQTIAKKLFAQLTIGMLAAAKRVEFQPWYGDVPADYTYKDSIFVYVPPADIRAKQAGDKSSLLNPIPPNYGNTTPWTNQLRNGIGRAIFNKQLTAVQRAALPSSEAVFAKTFETYMLNTDATPRTYMNALLDTSPNRAQHLAQATQELIAWLAIAALYKRPDIKTTVAFRQTDVNDPLADVELRDRSWSRDSTRLVINGWTMVLSGNEVVSFGNVQLSGTRLTIPSWVLNTFPVGLPLA